MTKALRISAYVVVGLLGLVLLAALWGATVPDPSIRQLLCFASGAAWGWIVFATFMLKEM